MPDKSKEFLCRHCLIRFLIEVEPDYSQEEVKKEYREALDWLDKVKTYPVCEKEIYTK